MTQAELDAINAQIAADALNPQAASVDGNSVTARDIDDQITAANHGAGQLAAGSPKFGLRLTQLVPPGCG